MGTYKSRVHCEQPQQLTEGLNTNLITRNTTTYNCYDYGLNTFQVHDATFIQFSLNGSNMGNGMLQSTFPELQYICTRRLWVMTSAERKIITQNLNLKNLTETNMHIRHGLRNFGTLKGPRSLIQFSIYIVFRYIRLDITNWVIIIPDGGITVKTLRPLT